MRDPALDPDHPVHVCPLCRQGNRLDPEPDTNGPGLRKGVTLTVGFYNTAKAGGWPNHTSTRFCEPCGMVVVDKLLELGYLQHPIEP